MIYLKESDYDSPEHCICGSSPVYAVLNANNICIPLCDSCLNELREELADYDAKTHCYQCEYFVRNSDGIKYGGLCLFGVKEEHIELVKESNDFGYYVDFNHYCKNGKKKIE